MILDRIGQSVVLDGVRFTIGMHVRVVDTDDYANLYGVVTEIRTDNDRDTENETQDIYCCFDAPVMPKDVAELEAHFSDLYGEQKRVDDLALDMVIMAPDMLIPLDDLEKDRAKLIVYAVIDDWCADTEGGHNEHLFTQMDDAKRVFHEILSVEQTEGCVHHWKDKNDFMLDVGEDYYECWLDGDYCENHFKLSIEQKTITADKGFLQSLNDPKECEDAAH